MDILEKFNRKFGAWYEGLFNDSDDVRPKDILRRILSAMESHRKEGFDNRVYVPNQYILEIAVNDEEEKEYLLAFLDRAELETAIQRCCKQNNYHLRGKLEFTIKEVTDEELSNAKRIEKVRVRCRYSMSIVQPEKPEIAANKLKSIEPDALPPGEDATVARVERDTEEDGTVPSALAAASLLVHTPGHAAYRYAITRKVIYIGRSLKNGNDLVIESDTQLSKKHARIELGANGEYTLFDNSSLNGSFVNRARVSSHNLQENDEITLGETLLRFQKTVRNGEARLSPKSDTHLQPPIYGGAASRITDTPQHLRSENRAARLSLMEGKRKLDEYRLGSETTIGRGVTNDIALNDRTVATRHARISLKSSDYYMESLRSDDAVTLINDLSVLPGQPALLKQGDRITLGNQTLRFDLENRE